MCMRCKWHYEEAKKNKPKNTMQDFFQDLFFFFFLKHLNQHIDTIFFLLNDSLSRHTAFVDLNMLTV